jgi:glycosyltransferase involved in cell wall biosynthesis
MRKDKQSSVVDRQILPEQQPSSQIELSIVAPFYNEEGNVARFVENVMAAAHKTGHSFEVIAVNDGSKDKTLTLLTDAIKDHKALKVIDLRRNYGQTAAMMAGIDAVRGKIIVTIDSDLQKGLA